MRLLAVAIAVAALLLAVGASAQRAGPIPIVQGRISITATPATVRVDGATVSSIMRLWNRALSAVPIGNATIVCRSIGTGGVLGNGLDDCRATYVLPLGKITASGVRHNPRFYSLVITGGTRRYVGISGSVIRRPERPRESRLVFILG